MEITEVRIKLMEGSEDRLRAFCSITIDQSFVVRDLKIIDGSHGPFVAMPSRKLTGHCGKCGGKNHLRATYCNQCGAKLQASSVTDTPQKLYADVAHPINSECREMIQNAVVEEFHAELQRAAQPNYRSRYDDEFDAGEYDEADYTESASPPPTVSNGVASQPADPIESSVRDTAKPPSSAEKAPSRPQSIVADVGSFGAGLFDAERSAVDTDVSADASGLNKHATDDGATDDGATDDGATDDGATDGEVIDSPDAIVVRGESGVQNSLPRPHFRDRPSSTAPALVPSNAPANAGRVSDFRSSASNDAAPSRPDAVKDDKDTADDSGFGAGIFDG